MKITAEIIQDEYMKASSKTVFIKKKAEELQVPQSTIVCELLKSGYKFEELNRANEAMYNAAVKKLNKWKESGSPLTEYEIPEAVPVAAEIRPVEDTTPTKPIEEDQPPVDETSPAEVAKLKMRLQEALKENAILKADFETAEQNYLNEFRRLKEAKKRLAKAEQFILDRFLYAESENDAEEDQTA